MKASVIGAGAFGTALANQLARVGNDVKIWAFESEVEADVNTNNENKLYLADVKLNENVHATNDLGDAYNFSNIVFLAPPFFALSKVLPKEASNKILVCASKGIEKETGKLAFEIVNTQVSGNFEIAVLSGASFAKEVASGMPTKVVVASKNQDAARKVAGLIQSENFKVEVSDDLVGVELGGALKNVLAIALGMVSGAGHGKDFNAAVFVEGLSETIKLGEAMGAKRETFYSIAGLGDYFVTATSKQSRNFTFGTKVAKGDKIRELLSGKNVVEGAATVQTVHMLCAKYKLNLPIFANVYSAIYEDKDPKATLDDIWSNL